MFSKFHNHLINNATVVDVFVSVAAVHVRGPSIEEI